MNLQSRRSGSSGGSVIRRRRRRLFEVTHGDYSIERDLLQSRETDGWFLTFDFG